MRFQVTPASGTSSSRRAVTCARTSARSRPSAPRSSSAGFIARPEVADAVHPGLGGNVQLRVAVQPLRVLRCEHVRLDPERGQVLGELQRSLHAAAAAGREVERDEQHLTA